jgi:hypothetical protein
MIIDTDILTQLIYKYIADATNAVALSAISVSPSLHPIFHHINMFDNVFYPLLKAMYSSMSIRGRMLIVVIVS